MLGANPSIEQQSNSNPFRNDHQSNSNPVEMDYKSNSNDDYEFKPFKPKNGFIIRTTYETPTESFKTEQTESDTTKNQSPTGFLSSFANQRALEKLTQFVTNENR